MFARYCIPVSDSRPIGAAEELFFSKCGTGKGKFSQLLFIYISNIASCAVPVVALFTKTDFFDDEIIEYLLTHDICQTIEEARVKASQQDWLGSRRQVSDQIRRLKHQPKDYVFLRSKHLHYNGLPKSDYKPNQTRYAITWS